MAIVRFATSLKPSILTPIQAAIDAGATGGTVKIYTGAMPTDPQTAISTQVLLGTLTFSKPCGVVASGVLTMSSIAQDSSADAGGTATWARIADANGVAVMDIDISVSGGIGAL